MKPKLIGDNFNQKTWKIRVEFFIRLALFEKIEKFANQRNCKCETILRNIIKKYAETYMLESSQDKKYPL